MGSPLQVFAVTPGTWNKGCSKWEACPSCSFCENNLNLDLSKSNSFTFKVALHPSKFSALHSQQGYLDAQWGSFRWLLKNSWCPCTAQMWALYPLGCKGCPAFPSSLLPFSKGLPSGSWVGWNPFPRASKDHFKYFQMVGQVSLAVQLLGKAASSWCCFMLAISPKKQPHDHTNIVSLVWYSTPSPYTNMGMEWGCQCFSKHMGWPSSLSSLVVCTPFQNFSKSPFPRWKVSLKNSG